MYPPQVSESERRKETRYILGEVKKMKGTRKKLGLRTKLGRERKAFPAPRGVCLEHQAESELW